MLLPFVVVPRIMSIATRHHYGMEDYKSVSLPLESSRNPRALFVVITVARCSAVQCGTMRPACSRHFRRWRMLSESSSTALQLLVLIRLLNTTSK